ncbi:MAG TPA: hypothetical protein VFI34_04205 [Candidatus Limnocylindrales bacterium]|nr:hypothetical protein [Candidatus Limnocylindrales bacterium]
MRDPDLILARVHLRLGTLGLARVELETIAGRGELDDDGVRDLAEARWRTGDIAGAGEAASAYLETQPGDILGLVIAAEAQAASGRPGEARRLAGLAIDRADGSLDPIFAGMPKSAIWPIEPGAAAGPAGVLFDDLHPGPHAVPALEQDDAQPLDPRPEAPIDGPSLWGDDAPGEHATAAPTDAGARFRQAREALDAGRPADAAAALLLALRGSPSIAPAVLDLLAGRSEPILAVVRGDASAIVGHDVDAMRDHAAAAAILDERSPATTAEPEAADPAPIDPPPDQEIS